MKHRWLTTLLVELYQRMKGPVDRLIKKERCVYLLTALAYLIALVVVSRVSSDGESLAKLMLLSGKAFALFAAVLSLLIFLLARLVDPVPEFVDPRIDQWKKNLRDASRGNGDTNLFGFTVKKAIKSDVVNVALLLSEAFGCRVIPYPGRVEICRTIIRRCPGSVLLLFKDGGLAGCCIILPLSKRSVTEFLSAELRESDLSDRHILTRHQARDCSPNILVSAIYLRQKYRTWEGRQALFLALFAAVTSLLLQSDRFLVLCEPVSKRGLKMAKRLGLDKHNHLSASRNSIFKLEYSNGRLVGADAERTLKYLFAIRNCLKQLRQMPSFLL